MLETHGTENGRRISDGENITPITVPSNTNNTNLSKQKMTNKEDTVDPLKPLPAMNAGEITDFEKRLTRAATPKAIKELFQSELGIDKEHLDFLENYEPAPEYAGAKKLREFYHQVLAFDLKYGTTTSWFISEERYKEIAKENPTALAADFSQVTHGVKHRASLTSTIVMGFNKAVEILKSHNLKPENASLYDLGSGTGKPSLIGKSPEFGFSFRRAVGIDYLAQAIQQAERNAQNEKLFPRDQRQAYDIGFKFGDAAKFDEYNGTNIVYMYNPFGKEIMLDVEEQLRTCGGSVVLVYNKPECGYIFNDAGWKKPFDTGDKIDPDHQISIYTSPNMR